MIFEALQNLIGLSFLITFGFLLILFVLAIYIYSSLAWRTIARKLKYKRPWLAWIPFANVAMILQLGEFPWAWVFLILIPIFGWIALSVLTIIAMWRIFEKRKYPGWLSLPRIVPWLGEIFYLIIIGFVAWEDRKERINFN